MLHTIQAGQLSFMKEFHIQILALTCLAALLSACGGGGSANSADTSSPPSAYNFDCTSANAYVPSINPIITSPDTAPARATIIFMHPKTSGPHLNHLLDFYADLAAYNFEVIAPRMPWAGFTWDGTLCEGLQYLTQLANAQAALGKTVFIAGHSMGGMHTLAYGVTTPLADIDGLIIVAPGHILHKANALLSDTAASVAQAQQMIANGQGNSSSSFVTRNGGNIELIDTTPNVYLSYHDTTVFPNIDDILPAIDLPTLWLAGASDPLTNNMNMAGLAAQITVTNSNYVLVNGDHIGMLTLSADQINIWANSLGL